MAADKGYHSNDVLTDLKTLEMRSYINEPDCGRRNWCGKPRQQQAVYGNRRRMRGKRGKRLSRLRGERVERSFAHLYEPGRMRRTHLRGHENILKRLLIHGGAFNLSLVLRKERGAGTPRGLAEAKKAFDCSGKLSGGPFQRGKRFCLGCGRGWSTDPSGSTRHPASAVPLAPLENRHFWHGLLAPAS